MSVITKDLGVATAYGYAKSKGYTGTEEEFAELMASYANVAQQAEASAQDAEDAKDAAITAKTAAQTAQTAAESAQTAAAGSAQTASTKASEASNSAQTAAGSATAAGNSATAAAGSASTAQTAAQTATTKASEASSSASAANTAKTDAQTARTGAQTAQTAAETAQANAEAAASSVSASAAQIEQNTEEIGAIKNDLLDGTFIVNNAENAEQLTSTVGIEDTAPYLFRTSGGSNDIGDREDVRKIVGGTIVNNQLIKINSTAGSGITFTQNNDGSTSLSGTATADYYAYLSKIALVEGHKYLSILDIISNPNSVAFDVGSLNGVAVNPVGTFNGRLAIIGSATQTREVTVGIQHMTVGSVMDGIRYNYIATDLTLAFGTAIADYAYSLETATAGAGVAWLKKHFPKQFDAGYQAYDAGSLQSVSGLTEHRMVGFNQFDADSAFEGATGITKNGNSFTGSANTFANFTNIAGWDKIKYISGLTYYGRVHITVPNSDLNWAAVEWVYTDGTKTIGNQILTNSSGVSYALSNPNKTISYFRITYGSNGGNPITVKDICINLHWDGEKDGTYEPYKTWSYALDDSVVIRGIPKVDANGNLYYDGDEYLPDGTVNRRFGIVDLGTLNWIAGSDSRYNTNTSLPGAIGVSTDLRCVKYIPDMGAANRTVDKSVCITNGGYVYIYDTAQTGDGSAFKTAMSGVYLLYPLATLTTETALPYQATQIVDDWGTEEYVLSDGAFPVPVGHDTMYQNNLRAKLEMSPESPDGDGLYVVQQESGENTYVPLASTATIQDILTRLTALENA